MRLSSVILCLVALSMFGGAMGSIFYVKKQRTKERRRAERAALYCLLTLSSAQSDFRANDRDNNRVNDFWTGDVAGLYILDAGGGMIRLIDKQLADADTNPLSPTGPPIPFQGYFFRVLDRDPTAPPGEEDYRTDTRGVSSRGKMYHPSRFGICAYPAVYDETTRWTWIINEGNTAFKCDNGGKFITAWPTDDELARNWVR